MADPRPVGEHLLTAGGTRPGQMRPGQMPSSGHLSRRTIVPHSTGGISVLDGVQYRQPVGAYAGLPVDYGRREPYLRPFDEIPAHQDASECEDRAWTQKGRDLTARISSLQLNQKMRNSELKQLERKLEVSLSEKRKYDDECEERGHNKRPKLAPERELTFKGF